MRKPAVAGGLLGGVGFSPPPAFGSSEGPVPLAGGVGTGLSCGSSATQAETITVVNRQSPYRWNDAVAEDAGMNRNCARFDPGSMHSG